VRATIASPPVAAGERPGSRAAGGAVSPARVAVAAAVVAIAGIAVALRFAALATQPGGLHPDEAAEGGDALRLLHQPGFHPVFFAGDGGREPLFAYLVAAAFRITGPSVTVLRGVAAALGVAGVLAILWALWRLGRGVALAGAAWAAGSLWLVAVARDGMRVVLVPLIGALALGALMRWADRPATLRAVVAGLATGLGLWSYQPLKLLPLLVALWLLALRGLDRRRFEQLRRGLPAAAAAYAAVAAPLLVYAALNPATYFGRAASVTPLGTSSSNAIDHTLRTLGMFCCVGDPNGRHDVGALPLLGLPLTLLAALGMLRAWRRRRDPGHLLLLLGIPVFLLPPLLSLEGGAPHFLRSLGLAPFIAGAVGLGCAELVDAARARRPAGRGSLLLPAAALTALLLGMAAASGRAYLARPAAERYLPYAGPVVQLAAAASSDSVVLIDDYQGMVVRFLDAEHLPRLATPTTGIHPPPGWSVLALNRGDLRRSLGAAAASRARVAARDPWGRPSVWEVAR
jgi:hypothetical protein